MDEYKNLSSKMNAAQFPKSENLNYLNLLEAIIYYLIIYRKYYDHFSNIGNYYCVIHYNTSEGTVYNYSLFFPFL